MTVVLSSMSKTSVVTPKELRHVAQGCRASRLPWGSVEMIGLP